MKRLWKVLLFVLIALGLVTSVQKLYFRSTDNISYNSQRGFYELPKNSLDGVYIGSSTTYQFWQPPIAWHNYGIAVYSLVGSNFPSAATKYWLIEAHKTQPDAVFLLNLNNFRDLPHTGFDQYHNSCDCMRLSLNKLRMLTAFSRRIEDVSLDTILELFFPIIRFHSAWNDIHPDEIFTGENGMMGASSTGSLMSKAGGISYRFRKESGRKDPYPEQIAILDELLETIDSLGVRVLFVITPQLIKAENMMVDNALADYVEARGYPCLNLQNMGGEMGLMSETDYYDRPHTNIHGSLKVTETISRYLLEHYAFSDKRGNSAYKNWENAAGDYLPKALSHVPDFEIENAVQRVDLPEPEALRCAYPSDGGAGLVISWSAFPVSVDGFALYRKADHGTWQFLGDADSSATSFSDNETEPGRVYDYCVVPYQENGETRFYGRWNIEGVSAGKYYPAPKMKEIWEDRNGVTVTWETAADEKDYRVFRRQGQGPWEKIAETKELWYTDGTVKPGVEYAYTVSAFFSDADGGYSENGISIKTETKQE